MPRKWQGSEGRRRYFVRLCTPDLHLEEEWRQKLRDGRRSKWHWALLFLAQLNLIPHCSRRGRYHQKQWHRKRQAKKQLRNARNAQWRLYGNRCRPASDSSARTTSTKGSLAVRVEI